MAVGATYNMTVSWRDGCAGTAQGGEMIVVLQVAGAVAALIGVVALYYGIPVKEFSFGNTLILVGTISLCTGAILLALSVVALELRLMARRLASVRPADSRAKPTLPPFPASAGAPVDDGSPTFEQSSATAVQIEPSRAPPVPEAAPPPPPKSKRNLLFQSSMRRDRERSEAGPAEPALPLSAAEAGATPPANFEDAWPKPDRMRGGETPLQRRTSRLSATPAEASAGAGTPPSPPQPEEQAAVTVLKSGVVDGMAYSLYSDGSIEAQMPEGMMRFASIDELRAHLDHRP
jgi:hypothetical protein